MLIVISPAKTLDFETQAPVQTHTQPEFLEDAEKLIRKLRTLSRKKVGELMGISEKLALLNYERYQTWEPPFTAENAKQAMFAFKGDVYVGLNAMDFSPEDTAFAQKHLRILSGLHGVLKPLDYMQPYRLEMGTKLSVGRKKNLYDFWGSKVTDKLNREMENHSGQTLINLASNEYFQVIQPKGVQGRIITPVFKELRGDTYKIISFSAKKARGLMSAFLIKNRIEEAENIKLFDAENYAFDANLSTENEWVFTR